MPQLGIFVSEVFGGSHFLRNGNSTITDLFLLFYRPPYLECPIIKNPFPKIWKGILHD